MTNCLAPPLEWARWDERETATNFDADGKGWFLIYAALVVILCVKSFQKSSFLDLRQKDELSRPALRVGSLRRALDGDQL